jgi:glycosyltransferase involved in cell wall biosynthesis
VADLLDRILARRVTTISPTESRAVPTGHPVVRATTAARPPVIFLGRNLVMGGAERAFLSYVHQARSIDPIVVLLEGRGGLLPELRPDVPSFDLSAGLLGRGPVADFLDELPGWTGVRLLRECRRLAALVRQTGSDVVCSFLMRAHLVALLTRRFLVPHLRVVLNIHEHWTDSAPYLYPRRRDRWLMRRITRHLFPSADRIVTVATAVRDDLVDRHGIAPDRVHVAFNPVDLTRIREEARRPLSASDEDFMRKPTIVGVGRLVPLKGFDLLLRAVALLREQLDAHVLLIGDGEERTRLTQLAAALGLSDVVRFAGWQANPWRFMARARAVAVTSHTEAFPCVLSEALTVGVPALSTDCSPGIGELLNSGACGLIVPSREPRAVASGLLRVLTDEPVREAFAARGLQRVEAFRPSVAVARYEGLLRELVAMRETVPALTSTA